MADLPQFPPASPLASATLRREGRSVTAVLRGELDLSSTPGIAAALDDAIAADDERIRIDLAQVSFCDSSGLAMLFRLGRRSSDDGLDFAVVNPTGSVRRILEMCDQSGVLPIRTDLDAPITPISFAD